MEISIFGWTFTLTVLASHEKTNLMKKQTSLVLAETQKWKNELVNQVQLSLLTIIPDLYIWMLIRSLSLFFYLFIYQIIESFQYTRIIPLNLFYTMSLVFGASNFYLHSQRVRIFTKVSKVSLTRSWTAFLLIISLNTYYMLLNYFLLIGLLSKTGFSLIQNLALVKLRFLSSL